MMPNWQVAQYFSYQRTEFSTTSLATKHLRELAFITRSSLFSALQILHSKKLSQRQSFMVCCNDPAVNSRSKALALPGMRACTYLTGHPSVLADDIMLPSLLQPQSVLTQINKGGLQMFEQEKLHISLVIGKALSYIHRWNVTSTATLYFHSTTWDKMLYFSTSYFS